MQAAQAWTQICLAAVKHLCLTLLINLYNIYLIIRKGSIHVSSSASSVIVSLSPASIRWNLTFEYVDASKGNEDSGDGSGDVVVEDSVESAEASDSEETEEKEEEPEIYLSSLLSHHS